MSINFSNLFHQASRNLRKGHPPIASDESRWPDEWRTTYYKEYKRFPHIKLLEPMAIQFDATTFTTRRSQRDFSKDKQLTQEIISTFLYYSCGERSQQPDVRTSRTYPSGGARFPIEIYPVILRQQDGIDSGLYHYSFKNHALEAVWQRTFSNEDIDALFTYPWTKKASMVIVMTSVFWRSQNKYGERGYRYILIESGHIGQNMYLVGNALNLKVCALGGTRDGEIEKLIDIDSSTESVTYAVAIGL